MSGTATPRPGRKHAFSLASKLATLDVGDAIYLPDNAVPAGATLMERQVQDRIHKVPLLKERRFSTTRADVITVGRVHEQVLKVERLG